MSRKTKYPDPSYRHVKTGISLPPRFLSDLEYISQCTHVSRSAILVAVASNYLHDVAESFRESVYLLRQDPKAELDGIAEEFLRKLAEYEGGHGSSPFFLPEEVVKHD